MVDQRGGGGRCGIILTRQPRQTEEEKEEVEEEHGLSTGENRHYRVDILPVCTVLYCFVVVTTELVSLY